MSKKYLNSIVITFTLLLITLIAIIAIQRPFISDEFHEAVLVNRLRSYVPYLDLQFYKNVLGYYVKLPLLYLPFSWFDKLIVTRLLLGSLFSVNMILIVRALKDFVDIWLYSLSLIVSLFVTQSILHVSAYRVDLLNFLCGFWCLVFLLKNRLLLAGVICGVGFCISQKGALYCIAGAVTIIATVPKNRGGLHDFIRFSLGGISVFFFYALFWGIISNPVQVLNTVFFRDTVMATGAGLSVRWYWIMSLVENLPVYLLSFCGLGLWFAKSKVEGLNGALIYSLVVFVLALSLGQPWPHWFILWTPFLSFFIYLSFEHLKERCRKIISATSMISIAFSLYSLLANYSFDNDFQRFNIELMERFLRPGETYLAGVDLHGDYVQTPSELSEMYAINRLKLFKESEFEKSKILSRLNREPPQIIVYNYRIPELLPRIQNYIDENYYHFFGNILSRQVSVSSESTVIEVPFSGKYLISSISDSFQIVIDGSPYKKGQTLSLMKGELSIDSNESGNLKLLPFSLNKPFPKEFLKLRSLHLTFSDKMEIHKKIRSFFN